MKEHSREIIQKTIDEWSPNAGYILSEEEAIEIIENTIALFDLLIELDRKYPTASVKQPDDDKH